MSLLAPRPGPYDDWLVYMFSTRNYQRAEGFDELVAADARDYERSGLNTPSVIPIGRLAVVADGMLLGCIGAIADERLNRIRMRFAAWARGSD